MKRTRSIQVVDGTRIDIETSVDSERATLRLGNYQAALSRSDLAALIQDLKAALDEMQG